MRKINPFLSIQKYSLLVFYLGFWSTTSAQTQSDTVELNEVVITGTRFETPVEKSGKTIYKLDQEDLEKNGGKSVADLLNEVPGIHIDGNFGTPGTNLNYFVRGGKNKHTLILIDGVPLNDPSGISLEYDLRFLSLDQVKSIEVLKGGLSTLYGSGAAAAVINIQLKHAEENGLHGKVGVNGGSYNTFEQTASINGGSEKVSYLLALNNLNSDGFSSALDNGEGSEFDKDGLNKQNALLKFDYTFNNKFKVALSSGYDQFESDYDGGAFFDATNVQKSKQFRVSLNPDYQYKNGLISLKVTNSSNEKEFISDFPSKYKGKSWLMDLSDQHYFSPEIKGLLGIGVQHLTYEQDKVNKLGDETFSIFDPYASVIYENIHGFNIHAGLRLNTHSNYDPKLVYNLNPSYILNIGDNLRLKVLASISSSYITPSLYQLYSAYGNKDLNPEEAVNLEGGISLYLNKSLTFNVVYFTRDEEQIIEFIPTFDPDGNFIGGQYNNTVNQRKVNGYEADVKWEINESIDLSLNYAHAESDNKASFYRIPNNKFGANLSVSPLNNMTISLKHQFTDDRTIFDWATSSELVLKKYHLTDLYISHSFINTRLKVYGAINNLFNEGYEGVYGFTTRGRNFNIGTNFNF